MFVDGRYTLQAKKEADKNFKVVEIHKIKPSKILEKVYQKLRIGFDPKLFSETNLLNNYQTKNITLVPIEKNLVDKIVTLKFLNPTWIQLRDSKNNVISPQDLENLEKKKRLKRL